MVYKGRRRLNFRGVFFFMSDGSEQTDRPVKVKGRKTRATDRTVKATERKGEATDRKGKTADGMIKATK